ncbi:MAG: hypothetical protein AAGF98_13010 [Cyanobacteria bacterium P01_H01_bin.153]
MKDRTSLGGYDGHQRDCQGRLRAIVKRLVIELGYLEHCLAEGLQDTNVQTATLALIRRFTSGEASPTTT